MIDYTGKSSYLIDLSKLNVSPEAFEMVEVITPRLFIALKNKELLHTKVWDSIVMLFKAAPESIQEYLDEAVEKYVQNVYGDLVEEGYFNEETKSQLKYDRVLDELHVSTVADMAHNEPAWLDDAPKVPKGIINIIVGYNPKVLAPEELKETVDSILDEAVEYTEYAGFYD